MKNQKKENFILATGFASILFVIVFTLLRNDWSDKSKEDNAGQNLDEQKTSSTVKYSNISANELNKKIMLPGKNEKMTLLDIRPFDAYIQDHIVDAVNISVSEFPIESKIDQHNLVVVIGQNNADKDIATAMDKLKQEGFKNTLALAGGMDTWKQMIGSTVTYGNPKSFVDQSKVSYLEPEKLNEAMTQKVPVYIVDVRSNDAFAKGHITGAINIPMDELEKRRSEIKEKKVVVVGDNELQEFQASVQMYDMLLISPFVMKTAMPGWQEKKFPLAK